MITNENTDAMWEAYRETYKGTNLSDDEIWEEIICDAYADMNEFANHSFAQQNAEWLQSVKGFAQDAVGKWRLSG